MSDTLTPYATRQPPLVDRDLLRLIVLDGSEAFIDELALLMARHRENLAKAARSTRDT